MRAFYLNFGKEAEAALVQSARLLSTIEELLAAFGARASMAATIVT